MRIAVLKFDGIGDFVLAVGGLRLLASVCGEENLLICLRAETAPLARVQFPRAKILSFKLRDKRKYLNVFFSNLIHNAGPILQVLTWHADWIISLRHARNYFLTMLLFLSPSRQRAMATNPLLESKKDRRGVLEKLCLFLRPSLVAAYPVETALNHPAELEAHRRVLSLVLQREVQMEEIQPVLNTGSAFPLHEGIVLCPLSSKKAKDYPMASWVQALLRVPAFCNGEKIVLAGSPEQGPALLAYKIALNEAGLKGAVVAETPDLPSFLHLLAAARLILTVDTAAAHMACAIDRPALILFSGLHTGVYAPWRRSKKQIWLTQEPRGAGVAPHKKRDWHLAFPADQVAELIQKLLDLEPLPPKKPASAQVTGPIALSKRVEI